MHRGETLKSMDHIAQIKARLPIAEVVGTYVRLERAGSNFRALCPFHKERTPSFNVSPARDAYYCFGCAKGGDIFTFVQEIEGLSFPEALQVLAAKAGVQLPERSSELLNQQKNAKERLVELMEVATKIFEAHLAKHDEARVYLHSRGLTDETIAKFRIGFAPLEWRALYDALHAKGFADSEIERSRVVKKIEGKGYYDTFRGRIMFPIMDPSGRVIAFTGRVWGDQKAPDGTPVAKYLNSPEGELYDKSRVLFAYDRAKVPMRKADCAVLVEGQMDCIMAHQAGAEHTIAISGTALTPPQISLIKRLTNKIILALDADSAGVQATLRSAKLALTQDIQVRVATIPDGKDPADFIALHPGKWDEVLASAEPVVPYLLRLYVKLGLHGEPLRERINKEVFPLVAAVPSRIAQAHLVLEVARLLGVREDVVWDDLKRSVREAEQEPVYEDERTEVVIERPPVRNVSPRIRAEEELLGLLLWQEIHPEAKLSHAAVRESRERLFKELEVAPLAPDEGDASRLLIMAESRYTPEAKLEEIAEELLDRIERELLKERQEFLLREIARAESAREDTSQFMSQYRSLTPRIIAVEDRMRNRAHLY
ncbi:MAG TPA: DNA primase [Candidatus Paceibacterota bacterium]|nr:DNA primase [Candidatus Paceibacterota bacterium]